MIRKTEPVSQSHVRRETQCLTSQLRAELALFLDGILHDTTHQRARKVNVDSAEECKNSKQDFAVRRTEVVYFEHDTKRAEQMNGREVTDRRCREKAHTGDEEGKSEDADRSHFHAWRPLLSPLPFIVQSNRLTYCPEVLESLNSCHIH